MINAAGSAICSICNGYLDKPGFKMCGSRHSVAPWTNGLRADEPPHPVPAVAADKRPDHSATPSHAAGSAAWRAVHPIQSEPLIEFGKPVTFEFGHKIVQAYRDSDSGYVFMDPPPADELNDYYQNEYPQQGAQAGYYLIEADYEANKNGHRARQLLHTYDALIGGAPRTSLELGCAYGGLVAELAKHGVEAQGSDINQGAIRQGIELKGNHNIFHADNLNTLSQIVSSVDLIYSFGSLEHDPNMFRVMAACRERLTDHGLLFLMVPNAMFLGSVFGGFKNNWWVNYPQHLYMLSPGFLPHVCRKLGFIPLYWDTRILFEVNAQPPVFDFFNEMTDLTRDVWQLVLLQSGFGMELNFALTPDTPANRKRFAATARAVNSTLERSRQQEIRIRQYVKSASRQERSPLETLAGGLNGPAM